MHDSIFFSSISDIEKIDDKFYLSDQDQNKVFVLDGELNFIESFGNYGTGSDEFNGLKNIVHNQNMIGISDVGSVSIKLFTKEHQYIKTVRLPKPVDIYIEFSMNNDNYFYQHTREPLLVNVFDTTSKITETIGNFSTDFSLPTKSRANFQTNQWHTVLDNNKLFLVNVCEPIILQYDVKTKKKLNTYDLSKLVALRSRIEYAKNKIEAAPNADAAFLIFDDVKVVNNDIYISYTENQVEPKKVFSNKILQLELFGNDEFTVKNIFQLNPNGWYETFTVEDNRLITFDYTSSTLEEYLIP